MNFPFNCLGCGFENYAKWAHIGRQVFCGACGRVATVPAPMEPAAGESRSGLAVRFACPACGRNFATKPALVGLKIRCNGCGAGVRVPACNSFPVENASAVLLHALARSSRAMARATGPARGARLSADYSNPVANAPAVVRNVNSGNRRVMVPAARVTVWAVEDDDEIDSSPLPEPLEVVGSLSRRESTAVVLPSRAETMDQVRQEAAQEAAVETKRIAEKATKAKKKKRKKTGFFDLQETLTLVGGVSVIVGVLALLAWYFPDFRYPLGGLLAVIGFVLYLLGAMSLRRLTDREGFFKSLAYRFFPPCQLWYVATRWEETQDYFAFFASGLVIVAIGVGVVTTSPTAKNAEKSERAYQDLVDEFVRGKGSKSPPPAMNTMDNRTN
jgi:hypothetical protein